MLGITVLPEYIQSEGVEGLLDNLQNRAPITAISTSPYVMTELAAEQGGQREPPADAEKGLVRLLDRPLWGKREVWIQTAPSFEPDRSLYKGLRYQPSESSEATRSEGPVLDAFIAAAHERGLKVYFQIQAAIPPGYRVQFGGSEEDDIPRLPDGSEPKQRLDKNGSLASPHILNYGEALLADLLRRYPDIDGFRIDWPEYPPYFLDSIFLDFGPHARRFANERGFDFESIRIQIEALYRFLHSQANDTEILSYADNPALLVERFPLIREWLQLKSALVSNLLTRYRAAIDANANSPKALIPSAFPPPWNTLSGFDYTAAGEIVDAISCKYYTMHWPMMLRNYSDALLKANSSLTSPTLARALCHALSAVAPTPPKCEQFEYPEPDEAHPVPLAALADKQSLVEATAPNTPIWPIAHSYGPNRDFSQRAQAVLAVSQDRLWVNRYAYLSDEKLDTLGKLFSQASS